MKTPLRICFDLRYRTESGGTTYAKQLTSHLLQLDRQNEYVLVKYAEQSFHFESQAAEIYTVPRRPVPMDLLWSNTVLPFVLKKKRVDVYHPLKWPIPCWNFAANIQTCHLPHHGKNGDVPQSFHNEMFNYFYGDHTYGLSKRVIAVSHFLKRVLIEDHKIPEEMIDVIYHGTHPTFRPLPAEEVTRALAPLGLKPGYILCVGNVSMIKNQITAVKALAAIPPGRRPHLVIAGSTAHPNSDFQRVSSTVESLQLTEFVTFLGFVNVDVLVPLLNGAAVMIMPSLQEGFGLALLEAFKCGTPVISTCVGPLEELARGRALILENPKDHLELAGLIQQMLSSAGLRKEISAKQIAFAQDFTWERSARMHLSVYERAALAR